MFISGVVEVYQRYQRYSGVTFAPKISNNTFFLLVMLTQKTIFESTDKKAYVRKAAKQCYV